MVKEDEKITRTCTDKKGNPFDCGANGYVSKINADGTYKCCETITGPYGPSGNPGTNGKNGEKGATGPTGPTGDTGPTGLTGPMGPIGPSGDVGPDGDQGPTSTEQGEKGPAGKDAVLDANGEATNVGPTGPMGDAGPAGPMGDAGLPGDSAIPLSPAPYHSALYEDDEQDSEDISDAIRRTLRLVSTRNKIQNILPHKEEIEYLNIDTNTPSLAQGNEYVITRY